MKTGFKNMRIKLSYCRRKEEEKYAKRMHKEVLKIKNETRRKRE
jgi:hypothetical protein